jgi:diadenosine tetraphosphatase ApaH/serine/threonine PP2A family protein phosphatase
VGLLLLIAVLNHGVAPARGGSIVTTGCVGFNNEDSSQWLSVQRGPSLGNDNEVYLYWLSQTYAYAIDAQYACHHLSISSVIHRSPRSHERRTRGQGAVLHL